MKTNTSNRRGRKATINVVEVSDTNKTFTLNDLKSLNPTVKSPTVTAFVNRKRASGEYVAVGTKSAGRGKPSIVYKFASNVSLVHEDDNCVVKVPESVRLMDSMAKKTVKTPKAKVSKKEEPVIEDAKTMKEVVAEKLNGDAITRLMNVLEETE
jgi:hypothetical protein